MAARGHRYDIDLSEGVVRSSMSGFDYVLMVVDRRILVVRAHHPPPPPPPPRPARAPPGPGAYGTFQQEAYAAALEDAYGGDPDCAQRLIVAAWLYGLR